LAYQYIQQLKEIANGQASKIWVIPAELSGAAQKIAEAFKEKG
jgi:regulator of protease activity HflC (stomatin/prohibitin superfamily)